MALRLSCGREMKGFFSPWLVSPVCMSPVICHWFTYIQWHLRSPREGWCHRAPQLKADWVGTALLQVPSGETLGLGDSMTGPHTHTDLFSLPHTHTHTHAQERARASYTTPQLHKVQFLHKALTLLHINFVRHKLFSPPLPSRPPNAELFGMNNGNKEAKGFWEH